MIRMLAEGSKMKKESYRKIITENFERKEVVCMLRAVSHVNTRVQSRLAQVPDSKGTEVMPQSNIDNIFRFRLLLLS